MKRLALVCALCTACAAPTGLPTRLAPIADPSSLPEEDAANAPSRVLGLDEDPPNFTASPEERLTDSGYARPAPIVQIEMPLASLPRLGKEQALLDKRRGKFNLVAHDGGYRLFIPEDLLAEVELSGFRGFTWTTVNDLPGLAAAGTVNYAGEVKCGHAGLPVSPEIERGIHLRGWTALAVSYVEYEGSYAGATCNAEATRFRTTTARAIWPGVLYAFVSSPESSSDDKAPDTLHVIGPQTAWLSGGPMPTTDELRPHVGSFSHVAVTLGEGSASIAMSFTDPALQTFRAIRVNRGVPFFRNQSSMTMLRPTARAIVDVDLSGPEGGTVRIAIQRLWWPSPALDTALASFASPRSKPRH